MRGASKVLCIISGIIDIFLTLGTLIFIIVALLGGLSSLLSQYGGSDTGPNINPTLMVLVVVLLCGTGFIISLIAAICAFNAAAGKRGACIATIIFGFMGENIFAVIGGILGAIAYRRNN